MGENEDFFLQSVSGTNMKNLRKVSEFKFDTYIGFQKSSVSNKIPFSHKGSC